MQNLTNLFKLIQLTRDQPQYGYALSGFAKGEQGDLAEHHYLVTFIAWQMALGLKRKGAKINTERVLEMALVHDLGELFGGDLSFYYARLKPEARKAAKAFQKHNESFISEFFTDKGAHYLELMQEESAKEKTDESLIVKISDLLEPMHFKHARNRLTKHEIVNAKEILELAGRLKDETAKKEMQKFVKSWQKDFHKKSLLDIIWKKKSKQSY